MLSKYYTLSTVEKRFTGIASCNAEMKEARVFLLKTMKVKIVSNRAKYKLIAPLKVPSEAVVLSTGIVEF